MAQPLGVQYGQKFTLVGPDGTQAVLNDSSDSNFIGALTPEQCTGLDSADVRENADDLVQMDGGVHGDFFYGRRPVTLAGKVYNAATVTQRNQWLDLLRRSTDALRPSAAVPLYTNLIPNPGFEAPSTAVAYSSVPGATVRRESGVWSYAGAYALRLRGTWTGAGQTISMYTHGQPQVNQPAGQRILCAPNTQYTITFKVNVVSLPSTAGFMSVGYLVEDAAGGSVNQVLASQALTTGVRTFTVMGTTGAAAAYIAPNIYIAGDAGSADVYVDSVTLTQTSGVTSPDVFDGNYASAALKGKWRGTQDASQSALYGAGYAKGNARLLWTPSGGVPVYLDLRRQQPLRVTGTGWDKDFLAQMVAEDPRIYSQALHSQSAGPAQSAGTSGVSFAPFAAGFAGGTPAASTQVLNDGSSTTFPTYYINGPSVNPAVYNATTGRAIAFAYTLAKSEGLVVDTLNKLVYLGSRPATHTNLVLNPGFRNDTSNWPAGVSTFYLNPGSSIAWTGSGGPGSGAADALPASYANVTTGGTQFAEGTQTTLATAGNYAAGVTYRAEVYVHPRTGSGVLSVLFGQDTISDFTQVDVTPSGWTKVTAYYTPTVNTNALKLTVRTATAQARIFGVAAAVVSVVSGKYGWPGYFDGSFSNAAWTGTANASSSVYYGDAEATTNNRYGAIDFTNTSWSGLVPGLNDLRLIPFSWSPGAGLRVDWRDAWL